MLKDGCKPARFPCYPVSYSGYQTKCGLKIMLSLYSTGKSYRSFQLIHIKRAFIHTCITSMHTSRIKHTQSCLHLKPTYLIAIGILQSHLRSKLQVPLDYPYDTWRAICRVVVNKRMLLVTVFLLWISNHVGSKKVLLSFDWTGQLYQTFFDYAPSIHWSIHAKHQCVSAA